uniref:Alternative protein MCM3AP n=1 Tax=Homo sapiens TaxID=9606 RepID=L8ECA8_HUMAN|nr:alternative protein MCM3AP [Homo sapiens]
MQCSNQYWGLNLSQRKPRAKLLLGFLHFPTQLVVHLEAWPLSLFLK